MIKENIIETVEELNKYDTNTPFFTFNNEVHLAKVVKCYDGDTINCVFKHNNKYQQFKVRMLNYDAPELKPKKTIQNREQEIKKAQKSKKQLEKYLLNKCVYLYCNKFDKYGRLLAEVRLKPKDRKTINEKMVQGGYGVPYFGGTKRQNKD